MDREDFSFSLRFGANLSARQWLRIFLFVFFFSGFLGGILIGIGFIIWCVWYLGRSEICLEENSQ